MISEKFPVIGDAQKRVIALFDEGRTLYKNLQFAEAKERFAAALALNQNDGPSKVYYSRCRHYMENPPPADWDGVFVMQTK